jgi:protein Tex
MLLEGTVTNVAAFGAFVDIGVHQDGLVHLSQLADRFVKDAHEVVKAGDVVRVRVVDIDIKRKRIGLTMRKHDEHASRPEQRADRTPRMPAAKLPERSGRGEPPPQGAFGAALAEAFKRK